MSIKTAFRPSSVRRLGLGPKTGLRRLMSLALSALFISVELYRQSATFAVGKEVSLDLLRRVATSIRERPPKRRAVSSESSFKVSRRPAAKPPGPVPSNARTLPPSAARPVSNCGPGICLGPVDPMAATVRAVKAAVRCPHPWSCHIPKRKARPYEFSRAEPLDAKRPPRANVPARRAPEVRLCEVGPRDSLQIKRPAASTLTVANPPIWLPNGSGLITHDSERAGLDRKSVV